MPKKAKTKKPKNKNKKKKSKGKGRVRKDEAKDGRARELLLKVIDKMGGSAAIYQDNPDQVIVARFNHPPFVVYWNHYTIEDVTAANVPGAAPAPTETTKVAE